MMWIGVEDSDTLEQTGISVDCQYGAPVYYAWYAFYRTTGAIYINNVSPGDAMVASVSYIATSTYTLSIYDTTAGWHRSFTGSGGAPQNALWIVEQSSDPTEYPLTNFSSMTFSSCHFNQVFYNGTTYSGSVTGEDAVTQITMIDSNGNIMVTTSNLSNDGSSFTVTWIRGT